MQTLRISIYYILSLIARPSCLYVVNTCLSFLEPNTKSVCVWKFDRTNGLIGLLKYISTTHQIETTANSENFFLGSNEKIYFFPFGIDRQTGNLRHHEGICNLWDEEVELVEEIDDCEGTFSMIVISGDLLVSKLVEGNERIVYMGYNKTKISIKTAHKCRL
jgi:hypothetical protein